MSHGASTKTEKQIKHAKKLINDSENNTVVATASSKNLRTKPNINNNTLTSVYHSIIAKKIDC